MLLLRDNVVVDCFIKNVTPHLPIKAKVEKRNLSLTLENHLARQRMGKPSALTDVYTLKVELEKRALYIELPLAFA